MGIRGGAGARAARGVEVSVLTTDLSEDNVAGQQPSAPRNLATCAGAVETQAKVAE